MKVLSRIDDELEQRAARKQYHDVKRGDVSSVMGMIVEKANASWAKFPPHTQSWRTREDLIQEGVAFTVSSAVKTFKPKLNNKFSTYLYVCLDNFYRYNAEPMTAKERYEGGTVSFDTDFFRGHRTNKCWLIADYMQSNMRYLSTEEKLICKIDAERAFIRVYAAASASLRKYLIRWILQPKNTKYRDGIEFRIAQQEFRKLSSKLGFTYTLAEFIVSDYEARKALAKKLIFSKTFITPTKDGTVEYELKPILEA